MRPHQKHILVLVALKKLAYQLNGKLSHEWGRLTLMVVLANGPACLSYYEDRLEVQGDTEDGPLGQAAQTLLAKGRVSAWVK